MSIGKCEDIADPAARAACRHQAVQDLQANMATCQDQFAKRLEVCGLLDGGVYDPPIDPARFVQGIDNLYLPMTPGTTLIYAGSSSQGQSHVEVEVTHETKPILGVTCTVVHDTKFVDGNLSEDTIDWFAQDIDGNVWYFGESSKGIVDGEIVSLEGSWIAGVDGAKPGIVMKGQLALDQLYRQEYALGVAEDVARVVAQGETVTVPYGTFTKCLRTEDFSALEPDVLENKSFAPGIGSIREVDVGTTKGIELVDIQHN